MLIAQALPVQWIRKFVDPGVTFCAEVLAAAFQTGGCAWLAASCRIQIKPSLAYIAPTGCFMAICASIKLALLALAFIKAITLGAFYTCLLVRTLLAYDTFRLVITVDNLAVHRHVIALNLFVTHIRP